MVLIMLINVVMNNVSGYACFYLDNAKLGYKNDQSGLGNLFSP